MQWHTQALAPVARKTQRARLQHRPTCRKQRVQGEAQARPLMRTSRSKVSDGKVESPHLCTRNGVPKRCHSVPQRCHLAEGDEKDHHCPRKGLG
eukprot:7859971-Alexandrium_andersonii.AAC.1